MHLITQCLLVVTWVNVTQAHKRNLQWEARVFGRFPSIIGQGSGLIYKVLTRDMDAIFLQILNGLDKGSAYALIALGLTLIFGTLGVVNFAHGALFMIGAFCAVSLQKILSISKITLDPDKDRFPWQPGQS